MRTQRRPLAASAGNETTLSSTITSGASSSMISSRRPCTKRAPSQSASNVGAMNSPSCSIVGLRKTGAVSRMKSIQNCPGASSCSGGGPRRIRRSSKPRASSVPANDSSTMKTTRCPRSRSTAPMPAQLLVGPWAPSGKKTIVAIGAQPRRPASVMPTTMVASAAAGSEAMIAATPPKSAYAPMANGNSREHARGRAPDGARP